MVFLQTLMLNVLLASLLQPVTWTALEFGGVKANQIAFSESAIDINVAGSGSPLVSVFSSPKNVREIVVTGKVTGELNLETDDLWTDGNDDALLRFGLIEPGTTKLSPLQRLTAPSWIKSMEALFTDKIEGLGKIHCFLLMPHEDMVDKSRTNPMADMFEERIAASPAEDGTFTLKVDLAETPITTAGLWLMADGDDTGSDFAVSITGIEISE